MIWLRMMSSEISSQKPFTSKVKVSPLPISPSPPSLPPSGVNVSDAKRREETMMLADANRLKNDPSLMAGVSPGGATLLHVAAAKNYLEVMELV